MALDPFGGETAGDNFVDGGGIFDEEGGFGGVDFFPGDEGWMDRGAGAEISATVGAAVFRVGVAVTFP